MKGLEPSRREALDPKSSVSTNFTTSAVEVFFKKDKKKDSVDKIQRNLKNGTPSTIRTCDLRLRRALLYPAELWKHYYKKWGK